MELRGKNTDFSETTNNFMENSADFSERLKNIIDYLNVTPNTFGQILGYNRSQTIYDLINNKCKPSYDFVKKLMDSEISDTISVDWLITGRGEMLRSDLPVAHRATEPGAGIPLIPINAMAGAFAGEQVVLELECERYVVPVFKEAEFLITVKGSSMIPKYNSGDIVACKRMPIDTFFQWNKVYVLDTEQGPLIKRVKKGSTDNTITIFSDNPNYEPFELPRTKIYHIALVVGVIRLE